MAKWFFEPGHTAAGFCVRHMMVTFVRGHFKDIHGTLIFDPTNPSATSVEATIDAAGIWTGEADRDAISRREKTSEDHFRGKAGRSCRRGRSNSHRRVDDSRCHPRGAATRPLSRAMADTLVGRRNRQRTESQGGLYRHRHNQSPRFRRELEQHLRQRWRRRRQHSRDYDRRRSDSARGMIACAASVRQR